MIRIITFLSLHILCAAQLWAQTQVQPGVLAYTTKDGLASDVAYEISQDSQGYLWIGTQEGLCRFDGSTFKCYAEEIGLIQSEILDVVIDAADRKWLSAISAPPMYVQNERATIIEGISTSESGKGIFSYVLENGGVCISNKTKLYRTNSESAEIIDSSDYPDREFRLLRHQGKSFLDSVSLFPLIQEMLQLDGKNRPDFIDNIRSYGKVFSLTRLSYLLDMSRIRFYSNKKNEIIITTDHGMFVVDRTKQGGLILRHLLKDYNIHSIFFDVDDNIWICTNGSGIFMIKSGSLNSIQKYLPGEGIWDVKARVMVSNDSTIYLITKDFGFYQYDLFSKKLNNLTDIVDEKIYGLDLRHDVLYLRTAGSLLPLNLENKMVLNRVVHARKFIKNSLVAENQEIFLFSNEMEQFKNRNLLKRIDLGHDLRVYSSAQVHDSLICIGTTQGLYIYNTHSLDNPYRFDADYAGTINDIKVLPNDRIIVAGKTGGLRFYSDLSKETETPDTILLPDHVCNEILVDEHRIWVATQSGVFKINRSDLSIGQWYNSSTGLKSDEIKAISRSDNLIWVASYSGIDVIDSDQNYVESMSNLDIAQLRINDQPYAIRDRLRLPYDSNSVIIDYNHIQFGLKESVFEYRMMGHDPTAIRTKNKTAYYSKLPPGEYTFQIAARLFNGQKSGQKSFQLIIGPPWWRSASFYVFSGGLILMAGYFLFSDYKRRNSIKMKLVQSRLSAIHAQINPHFLFNSLQSLQYYISNNESSKAHSYLSTFASFIRETLETSRYDSILLKDEIEYLTNYLEFENQKRETKFEFNFDNQCQHLEFTFIPSMIIQPFVENVLVHGFIKEGSDQCINICFRPISKYTVQCSISDNGSGLITSKKGSKSNHNSFATGAIREKLKLLYSLYIPRSQRPKYYAKITDSQASSDNMFEQGVTSTLNLPINLKRTHES